MGNLTPNADHTRIDFDPETLTPAQLAGRACVVCGNENGNLKAMELYAHEGGETWLYACSCADPVTQARSTTDAALQHLQDLMANGMDVGLSREFIEAFTVEMSATRAKADQLSADIDAFAERAKVAEGHLLKAFTWGNLAAAQIAHDLNMSGSDMHAMTEDRDSVFTVAEREQLTAALNSVLDARRGATVAGWKPAPMPFDSEGRCDDPSCISCRTSTVKATA
ncbi:hypothetical protein [Nonomuraea candida]|uniref:hypothetical protein n=1 Tax=Nonomuraea candida TaxID=359159 RepID=UPI0005B88A3B|nr:hypothetical protein [Nonomuraea candida]